MEEKSGEEKGEIENKNGWRTGQMERMRRERSGSMGMIEEWCKRKKKESGEDVGGDGEKNGRARH